MKTQRLKLKTLMETLDEIADHARDPYLKQVIEERKKRIADENHIIEK